MPALKTAFMHYTGPPVVGGVEGVLGSHAQTFLDAGYLVKVIVGRGESKSLPAGVEFELVREMDTRHPQTLEISADLEKGHVPNSFAPARDNLVDLLRPRLAGIDVLIVHNIFSKHYNLPLTAALYQMTQEGAIRRCLAWNHDLTWTSPSSRSKVYPGYPWNLLNTAHPGIKYVTISKQRQKELAQLLHIPLSEVTVVYNGVDPKLWYGLSDEGWRLVQRMRLLSGDLILIMPVRVTKVKNIELAERILSALKKFDRQPRLVITGPPDPHSDASGAYYQSLLDMRDKLGLVDEVWFVYELGDTPDSPKIINQQVVSDLMRVSDIVFLPSHHEGFGMPVIEAGLIGLPILCSANIPAANEIGAENVFFFSPDSNPVDIARMIIDEVANTRSQRFRRQVRQTLTWDYIFEQNIEPLLKELING